MKTLQRLFAITLLGLTLGSFSACSHNGDTDTTARDQDLQKPVAGNDQTAHFANNVGTVQNSTTDPYTHSGDKANYTGKAPIATNQTPADKAQNHP